MRSGFTFGGCTSVCNDPTDIGRRKSSLQGEQSREMIIGRTERLDGPRGYAATSISDIGKVRAAAQLHILAFGPRNV